MSNSGFGKTMKSEQKSSVVEIVCTRTLLLAQTKKMWMKTDKIFNNDLPAITFKPRKIHFNEATIVGATILNLSKRHIF